MSNSANFISPFLDNRERIFENSSGFVIFDKFPVSEGHCLVVPHRVYSNYFDSTDDEVIGLNRLLFQTKEFLVKNTRENDLSMFTDLIGDQGYEDHRDIPLTVILPAYITSELKTAFQIGFLLFLPFLVIDLVIASILMSLGMMMLSPMLVALPFKLLLFVLVDGWAMTVGSLVATYVSN